MEQLQRANAHVLGVVINRIPKPGLAITAATAIYSSYYYYRSDYYAAENSQSNGKGPDQR